MGRRKTAYLDLPVNVTARVCGDGLLFYFQRDGKKIPLGANRAEAIRRADLISRKVDDIGLHVPKSGLRAKGWVG